MNVERYKDTKNRYNLFEEEKHKNMYKFFLEHALNVYLYISEKYNSLPSYRHISSLFNPLYGDSYEEEFITICENFLLYKLEDDGGEIGSCYESVEDYVRDQIEERYYELDIFYKDDLLLAWKEDLNLFHLDETQVDLIQNIPFERVW